MRNFETLLCVLLVTGCQTIGAERELPVSAPLDPLPSPSLEIGEIWHATDGKRNQSARVLGTNPLKVQWLGSSCVYTYSGSYFLSPLREVSGNCVGEIIFQNVNTVGGTLWPLKVGNSATFNGEGRYPGRPDWPLAMRCEVAAEVRIDTAFGELDAFKVPCRTPWADWIWYISPEMKMPLRWDRLARGGEAGSAIVIRAASFGSGRERPVSKTLDPMPKPTLSVGDKLLGNWNGNKRTTTTVTAIDGDVVTLERGDGCKRTVELWNFRPPDRWSGCELEPDASIKRVTSTGNLWPLRVGNTASYEVTVRYDKGGSWERNRDCEVDSQIRVETATGQHDTYKVVCRDETRDQIWYVSPDVRQIVRWEEFGKIDEFHSVFELISVQSTEPGAN